MITKYNILILILVLQQCVIDHVEIANLWYHNNGMTVNKTKVGKTDYSFSFMESIDMFGMNIDNKLNLNIDIQRNGLKTLS